MTKQKKDNGQTAEWEFNAVKVKSEAAPERKMARAKISEGRAKSESLALDEGAVPRTKTRSAMAMEMMGEQEQDEKDVFEYAPYHKRGIAFILDTVFTAGILYVAKMSAPLWRLPIQMFLDKYKLELWISDPVLVNILIAVNIILAVFFFIIIPVAFFNHSLGKKIMGLKIRGEDKYTISISEAFQREIIMKPLGIIILAGFIMPFFSKQKMSIHDKVVHTLVIEE